MEQRILSAEGGYCQVDAWLREIGARRLLLVCGKSMQRLAVADYFRALPQRLGVQVTYFSDFAPNPRYESTVAGVRAFRENGCDAIVAVGGGSAMDVAKCVKLFCTMPAGENYLAQPIIANDVPFLAMPTTAGTGSEATRFAVLYYEGNKQSVAHDSCLPQAVLMDPGALAPLPMYQRKATMLDALCHAVESFWSVKSTPESQDYAAAAIAGIRAHKDGYLANTPAGNAGMLRAANLAGKAINLTQTTAGHAMCYKITTLYGVAHGHAAALVNRGLWLWMLEHPAACADPRGQAYLQQMFTRLGTALGGDSARAGAERFRALFDGLNLEIPAATPEDLALLTVSVNPERLKNNPIALDAAAIDALYKQILVQSA